MKTTLSEKKCFHQLSLTRIMENEVAFAAFLLTLAKTQMKTLVLSLLPLCAALVFAFDGYSQSTTKDSPPAGSSSFSSSLARGTGKAAIIIVGSAAEATWVTTKFAVNYAVKPVAKTIFLKAAPKAALFVIKRSPTVTKKIAPKLLKLALL